MVQDDIPVSFVPFSDPWGPVLFSLPLSESVDDPTRFGAPWHSRLGVGNCSRFQGQSERILVIMMVDGVLIMVFEEKVPD